MAMKSSSKRQVPRKPSITKEPAQKGAGAGYALGPRKPPPIPAAALQKDWQPPLPIQDRMTITMTNAMGPTDEYVPSHCDASHRLQVFANSRL
jgi:hypothetical protein